ncbi:MAG: hypothetical protein HY927_15215 [Elusimicrobia bacterium]|nr:hypothetical protein [Elusimicrobiota bacterium]
MELASWAKLRNSCRSVRAVPLPAPWLEERRAAWRRALPPLADRAEPKPFDFLLTTSELYRYPPAPGSSTAPHSGCLPEIAAALEGEDAGIIHRETSTLLRSLAAFKSGPRGWMAEPKRAQAVRRFCRRYAWAEDDWPAHWRNFLDGLACDRHADPEF